LTTQSFQSYQWYLNGQAIAGATAQNFAAMQNGSYTVFVSGVNGCGDTSTVYTLSNLGINNEEEMDKISLYPNPNSGRFTLMFADDAVRSLYITDALGRIVLTQDVNTKLSLIKMDGNAAGIYSVHIRQMDQTRTIRFTIVK
jgi:hypothetical protein